MAPRAHPRRTLVHALAVLFTAVSLPAALGAQQQPIDQEYTAKIREHLQDPRISTELVDHLPAHPTIPTPLKFFGRIVGTPGELTYAATSTGTTRRSTPPPTA